MVHSSDVCIWANFPAKLHEYCWQAAAEHQDANHRAGQALAELLVRTLRLQGKYLVLGGRGCYPVLSKKWPQPLRGRVFPPHIDVRLLSYSHVPCCLFSLNAVSWHFYTFLQTRWIGVSPSRYYPLMPASIVGQHLYTIHHHHRHHQWVDNRSLI